MPFETPAQYDARMQRCRDLGRGWTLDEAMRTVDLLGRIQVSQMTPDERDRFVAANMVIRGEV